MNYVTDAAYNYLNAYKNILERRLIMPYTEK